ncbi:MAG TPA: hypothetical protein VFT78_02165 [Hanamia sp.]|nr:hypothetical protein [Hanamia sp.]
MPTNHFIPLEQAKTMTSLYRGEMNNILAAPYQGKGILPVCETFDRAAFDTLLAETGCTAVRIYYGMSDDLKVHAVVVGVNSNNEDILPAAGNTLGTEEDPVILEEATRCPDDCPPDSPINS